MVQAVPAAPASPRAGSHRLFYGWIVVAAVLIVLSVGSGFGFYALGVYLKALNKERGFRVSDISAAT